jgi:hypothetical protein
MKQLKARIEALDVEIASERVQFVKALEGEYKSALAAEAALQRRMSELREEVQNLRDRSIDYNILNREADTLRTQYDALLARYKDVAIAAGIGASQVLVVDRAEVPGAPFEPNIRSELLRAFALSFGLAIGAALLLEFIDDTIKTPEDVRSKLGLSILGVVPALKGKPDVSALLRDPMSALSEAFSSVRIALQVSTAQGVDKTEVAQPEAAMGHRHRSPHRSSDHKRRQSAPMPEALRAAERIHASTTAHWRALINDPEHPGKKLEMQAFEQRQRARSHRLELGRVPAEPWTHDSSGVR